MSEEKQVGLQAGNWTQWQTSETGQRQGKPEPLWYKEVTSADRAIDLPPPAPELLQTSLGEVLQRRRSQRKFSHDAPLQLEQLSTLLWAVQGISGPDRRRRTAPSAGARHPFETYIVARNVIGLAPGVYRYQVEHHQLAAIAPHLDIDRLETQVTVGCLGQGFVGRAPVIFLWTALPERTAWRYGELAPKLIALDAGHLMQNLYLAAEAMNCGTCAIGAYDQKALDEFLGVDGQDEFVIYGAPVGVPME